MTDAKPRAVHHFARNGAGDGGEATVGSRFADSGHPDFPVDSLRPSDMDFLLETSRGSDEYEDDELVRCLQVSESEEHQRDVTPLESPAELIRRKAKPIPVPKPEPAASNSATLPPSQPSSQGSSASTFLNRMLNPQPLLSHTPPAVASSYEAAHFGKRARSGSVSGRLRSASEFLEQKGLLDRNTKAILKDLIIIGDEELQQAIDCYESGDPSKLENMIQTGALQNRLPNDIDLLGDLDFDFLNMNDDLGPDIDANTEPLRAASIDDSTVIPEPSVVSSNHPAGKAMALHISGSDQQNAGAATPSFDGIGDLDFAGDLMSDQESYSQFQRDDSKQASVANSPGETSNLSDFEHRMRSNSLFSALLSDSRNPNPSETVPTEAHQYGKWMDRQHEQSQKQRMQPYTENGGGIGASLEAEKKSLEKESKREMKLKAKRERKEKKERDKKEAEKLEREEHVTGCGRPRSLSDPNLYSSLDSDGLQLVERPGGWVGAYSPESRRVRIDRFMEKRNHRVWTKTVKYDVRKDFANSRLRVKGRFVKKEDEVLMRELMSLT